MARVIAVILALQMVCNTLTAAEPLHVRIDKLIDAAQIGPHAPQIDDAEFLRRVSLHLTGMVPSVPEARNFLEDKTPDKRAKLVEQLMSRPEFARHMTNSVSVMLMERRTNAGDWLTFLKTSIEQNKPWNEIAAAIIENDGVDAKNRGPVNFYLVRNVEPNLLTREFGRMFFGMDLQCAQCHDHPIIDDYLQQDYYGIFAFLSRTYQFQPDKKKPAVLADNPKNDVNFKSVFTGFEGKTRPRLPGESEIEEPTYKKDDEYKVKPDKKKKNLRPIPKYSRREKFAEMVRKGTNTAFRRNIANRLWAHMMGRGLVHPVDLHHSDNPPSHPELMALLADEFATMKFDMRAFLKELALTKTYQRSIALPGQLAEKSQSMAQRLAALQESHKQLSANLDALDNQISETNEKLEASTNTKKPLDEALTKANAAVAAAQKAHDPNAKALAESQKKLAAKQVLATPLADTTGKLQAAAKLLDNDKQLAGILKSLTPKSQKLNSEAAALAKNVAAQSAKAKTTGDALTAAQNTAKAAQTKVDAAQKQIDAINSKTAELTRNRQAVNARATVTEQRAKTITTLIDYGTKLKTVNESKAAADTAVAAARTVEQSLAKARTTERQAKQEFDQASKLNDVATKVLAETKKQLTEKPVVATATNQAATTLTAALAKIPTDSELKAITDKLQAKSNSLKSEVAALTKALPDRESAAKAMANRLVAAKKSHESAVSAVAAIDKQFAPLAAKRNDAVTKASKANAALDVSYKELTGLWSKQFVMRPLEPLTPEQMAFSIMKINGLIERQRAASAAEINKKTPLKPEEMKDPAKVAARQKQIDDAAYAKLNGNVAQFVKLFAANAGQPQHDFFATFDQALFFSNAGTIRSWVSPSGGNLSDRLIEITEPQKLAEELYLGVLTRRPSKEEAATVEQYLASRPKEKSVAVQDLVWALLTSTEFRFNH